MTLRDEVWNEVIPLLCEEGRFTIGDLPFSESQRHTVRRVLREQQQMDWLTRNPPNSKIWRAGEKSYEHLNLSKRAEVMAKED